MKIIEQAENEQLEEMDILHRVARGDRAGFDLLHQRFSGIVYSTIYKVLNDREDTQDVAQEVFAQIWKKARLYEASKGKPLTWVATMARNRAIDRLRSKQRRARLRDAFSEEEKTADFMTQRDAFDDVAASEAGEVVRSAVLELSDEQRQAIEMAYFGGMTQSEIADNLGEPLGTVKARIRRGMIKLKKKVEPRL